MNFGARATSGRDEAIRIVRPALDAGITIIGTAGSCSQGESGTVTGIALRGRRESVVVAFAIV
jgi:aryl-alcohol dehydrogenase-like predicted oxidoreductase